MLSGVGIVCFAGSYAVALALEVSRILFRSGVRGTVMLGFAAAGLFAHTVFLIHRAAAAGSPLANQQEWYLVAAWLLAGVYLYLACFHAKKAFGIFILPLVLGLIGMGTWAAGTQPLDLRPASRVWTAVHSGSILLATVSMLIGFASGVMYLGQVHRLKRKLPPARGLQLPSLEWLQRANSRAVVVSLFLLGVGIVAGIMLNLISRREQLPQVPWSDPLVLSTGGLFAWLLASAGVGLFYKPARQGRKVAYFTLISFVFLVIALGIGASMVTRHNTPEPEGRGQGLGFRVQGSGFRVQGSGFGDQGPGFRGQGLGFRVQGSGFRGEGTATAPGRVICEFAVTVSSPVPQPPVLSTRYSVLSTQYSALCAHFPAPIAPSRHCLSLASRPSSLTPGPSSLAPLPGDAA